MTKATSLRSAKTEAQIIELPRDHYGFNNWTIMTDGYRVWISKQKLGEPATDHIEVPKGIFDRLLTLYEREQTPRRTASQRQGEPR
jgi:hypothetical protein